MCRKSPCENSSFCVESVALYYFKLAYVVLHMSVKELFKKNTSKMREIGHLNRSLLIESF